MGFYARSIKNALAQTQNGQSSPASSQDRKAEATRLLQQGQQQYSQGQFREALETLQQVLVIAREIGDKTLTAVALNGIGLVYGNLGQYPKALEFYQQALAIVREVGDRAGEGVTLNNIGQVYDSLGQYPKALEFFQQERLKSRLHKQSLRRQALKALARLRRLRLYSRTMRGCRRKFKSFSPPSQASFV